MRIVIDLQGAQNGSRHRGIGRYTLALTKAILRAKYNHEIFLVLNGLFPESIESIRSIFDEHLRQENIRVWHAPGPAGFLNANNTWRRSAAELLREAFILSLAPDVVLVTSLFEGAGDNVVTSVARFTKRITTAVIVYDLIPLLNRDAYLDDVRVEEWYMEKLNHLKKADLWLAISEASRKEAITHADIPEHRIFNISTAADEKFCPAAVATENLTPALKKHGITRPFVMYSGATDPRKNHLRLITAYANLPRDIRNEHQLVLAGGMPADHAAIFRKHAKDSGLADVEMVITGHISDETMIMLYRSCKCFVFPTWHEGFGLPALEAMSCGAAVIGSNTSSVPEVIGEPDALFDPFDESTISEKIKRVLSDKDFRERLIQHGLKQSKTFSWDVTAERALAALEKVILGEGKKSASSLENQSNSQLISSLIDAIAKLPNPPDDNTVLLNLAKAIEDSFPDEEQSKTLFVDISELVRRDSKTGIQRTVRSIINVLLNTKPLEFEIEFVYATENAPYRKARSYINLLRGCHASPSDDEIVEPQQGDIFLGLDFHDAIVAAHEHYFDRLHQKGVKVLFVVYDLLPLTLKKYFRQEVQDNYARWLRTVAHFDGAICISKSVARQLKEWAKVNRPSNRRPFDIGWFHLGADINASAPSKGIPAGAENTLSVFGHRASFLMVGTLEPRKGHMQVLAAFEALWKDEIDVNLVLVGKLGWMMESLDARLRQHPELGKRLFWLNDVSDEYLEKIYAACCCLIAASEDEGFGLPLIEAAQHKLPIIARDIPVFREVAGEHAYYFDGFDPYVLSGAVKAWLGLHSNGEAPKSDNIPWLTWEQSTRQLLQAVFRSS